jgi:hypothetical protein
LLVRRLRRRRPQSDAYGDHIEGGVDDDYVYMIYDFDGDGEYETEFTFER